MGYWEEKRKYEELKGLKKPINSNHQHLGMCINCGKISNVIGTCAGWHFKIRIARCLCKDCGFKCKKCKKVFCPKHKVSHYH